MTKPLSDAAVEHLGRLSDWPDFGGARYEAVEELGRGGMGAVFRAHDLRLDRDVAVKVLHAADRPASLAERLDREARILARLEHPGIVPVHDLGVLADGRVYYVMKLVRGRRLDAWLAGNPSRRERLELLRRVADTVAFANAHAVVHRDLKPSNIMVGEFGEVLVLDWGVAKVLSDAAPERSAVANAGATAGGAAGIAEPGSTAHGTVIGTAGFMAPEQERGEIGRIDARTDVFGLGALLRAVAGDLPRRLAAVAGKATAAAPGERYPDAAAFGADLARFLDGEPVSAYPEGPLERLERVAFKYRAALVLVLVYLLLRALFIILAGR